MCDTRPHSTWSSSNESIRWINLTIDPPHRPSKNPKRLLVDRWEVPWDTRSLKRWMVNKRDQVQWEVFNTYTSAHNWPIRSSQSQTPLSCRASNEKRDTRSPRIVANPTAWDTNPIAECPCRSANLLDSQERLDSKVQKEHLHLEQLEKFTDSRHQDWWIVEDWTDWRQSRSWWRRWCILGGWCSNTPRWVHRGKLWLRTDRIWEAEDNHPASDYNQGQDK